MTASVDTDTKNKLGSLLSEDKPKNKQKSKEEDDEYHITSKKSF